MKKILFILTAFFMFAAFNANFAADIKTAEIETSAQCNTCKMTIEKALSKIDGVAESEVNTDNAVCTVKYHTSKTDLNKIKKAISKSGYDADEVSADPKAYSKLHTCCKKPGDK